MIARCAKQPTIFEELTLTSSTDSSLHFLLSVASSVRHLGSSTRSGIANGTAVTEPAGDVGQPTDRVVVFWSTGWEAIAINSHYRDARLERRAGRYRDST